MTWLYVLGPVLLYLAVMLLSLRPLGRYYLNRPDPYSYAALRPRARTLETGFSIVALALIWPVTLLVLAALRVVPETPIEQDERIKEMERTIARLERESR
jgi:hypothetical protein